MLNGIILTNWTHPDVPFDGRVWTKTADGRSYPLVAYGENGAPSIVPELAAPDAVPANVAQRNRRPKYRDFLGVGAMSSWFTGLAGESSSTADGFEVRDGVAMTSSLDFVGQVAWSSLHHYTPDPSTSETTSRFAFGFQWRPFAKDARPRDRFSLENFYVLADLGYARLDRGMGDTRDEVTSGFAAGAGAGWTLHLTRGLGVGVEVSDHALFFTNDDITAHDLTATVLADVFPWW
ncbi:MAG: outer membrane beta-barrel protein [Deltaproteobacteria bacterium]